jgi:alpha-tubulin suppressor-like RCC1 family protein
MKALITFSLCWLAVPVFFTITAEAQPVTRVAGGFGHTLFTKSDGSLWVMGYDADGQLGDGLPQGSTNRPEKIATANVTAISAGEFDSMFITNGALWDMGYNGFYGELGNASSLNATTPIMIEASNVTAIASGELFNLFLKSDGSLWAMGNNSSGQLGDNTTDNGNFYTNLPEQVVPTNVTAIAAGFTHSLFIKSDGSLWGMGNDYYGQLGDGIYNTNGLQGTNQPEKIVPGNVTAIAAGQGHSLFLKADGSLWGMGWNQNGQLGDGTTNNVNRPEMIVASNVVAIAAGEAHSLFLKSDGSLWGMGDDVYGQLGDGSFAASAPYGTNRPEELVPGNVTAIGAGYFHSLVIQNGGSLWGTGQNVYGQLGDGLTYPVFSPFNATNRLEQVLGPYNQISARSLGGNNQQFYYVGVAGTNYALDRCFSLNNPNWVPQATNAATTYGVLILTNSANPATNNFWRIRSVP